PPAGAARDLHRRALRADHAVASLGEFWSSSGQLDRSACASRDDVAAAVGLDTGGTDSNGDGMDGGATHHSSGGADQSRASPTWPPVLLAGGRPHAGAGPVDRTK